jgi:hypothetical protein
MTVFGIDTGIRTLREADELIHDLVDRLRLPDQVVACTHLIEPGPHVAVSLWVPAEFDGVWNELTQFAERGLAGVASGTGRSGRPDLAAAAADAAVEHLSRKAGRAVVFPGAAALTGTVIIGELLARSAISRVAAAGGAQPPREADLLDTGDHVRPEWQSGELVLAVRPVRDGRYVPAEVPGPAPCRADHP